MSEQMRVGDQLAEWIGEAVTRHGTNESVLWDISFGLMPDEQGNPVGTYTIAVSLKGAILGTRVSLFAQLPFDASHSKEGVDGAIRQMVENIKEQRSEQLSEKVLPVGSLIAP